MRHVTLPVYNLNDLDNKSKASALIHCQGMLMNDFMNSHVAHDFNKEFVMLLNAAGIQIDSINFPINMRDCEITTFHGLTMRGYSYPTVDMNRVKTILKQYNKRDSYIDHIEQSIIELSRLPSVEFVIVDGEKQSVSDEPFKPHLKFVSLLTSLSSFYYCTVSDLYCDVLDRQDWVIEHIEREMIEFYSNGDIFKHH